MNTRLSFYKVATTLLFFTIVTLFVFVCGCKRPQDPKQPPEQEEPGEEPSEGNPQEVSNQVIVKFDPGTSQAQIDQAKTDLMKHADKIYECPCEDNLLLVEYDPTVIDPDEREQVAEDDLDPSGAGSVFPNFEVLLDTLKESHSLDQNTINISSPLVAEDIVVAIIDGGINVNTGPITNNIWENPIETPNNNGVYGVDDDGNCLVDDINGYDFSKRFNPSSHMNSHGTAVSDVLINSVPVKVRPNVKLMDLRVFDENGTGYLFDGLCAISYAIKQKAHIINMSWGYYSNTPDDLLYQYLEEARDNNMIIVTSAGNDSEDTDIKNYYPARFSNEPSLSNVINVAALQVNTSATTLASYSNYGDETVGIAARGNHIISSTGAGVIGTSFSAPVVSAKAAELIFFTNSNVTNSHVNVDIVQCILDKAVPMPGLQVMTEGILDETFNACN